MKKLKRVKTLKEPKKFDKPRAYMLQKGLGRLRIIYPSGKTEVSGHIFSSSLGTFEYAKNSFEYNKGKGCWAPISGKFKNGFKALLAMRKYDLRNKQHATYLGEF